jgi:hypothetical protein
MGLKKAVESEEKCQSMNSLVGVLCRCYIEHFCEREENHEGEHECECGVAWDD